MATGLVRKKLDEVEAELKRMLKRDEAFVRALRNDVDVNHRQRSVLQMALSNPEAVFRIESHQKPTRSLTPRRVPTCTVSSTLGF